MNRRQLACSTAKWIRLGMGVATASYAGYVAHTWWRYGAAPKSDAKNADPMLDRFMPKYDVRDRHKCDVLAPPEVAIGAATALNLEECPIVRAIFKGRELIMRSKPDNTIRPKGLLSEVKSLGWTVLAFVPGREIVIGAVTKPWEPNPVFVGLPADEFAAFEDPGYVKIVWTLRADGTANGGSIFHTETRAIATDAEARKRFRAYWSFLSPGIIAIRRVMLPAVKAEAERRWQSIAA